MGLKFSCTQAEFVPGKFPFVVVRQLGGVYKRVAVAISALNDLPANLISGFLGDKERNVNFKDLIYYLCDSQSSKKNVWQNLCNSNHVNVECFTAVI